MPAPWISTHQGARQPHLQPTGAAAAAQMQNTSLTPAPHTEPDHCVHAQGLSLKLWTTRLTSITGFHCSEHAQKGWEGYEATSESTYNEGTP